jgi:hypothetical protein
MIGKVVRGANVGGLLRYLYGPGRTNEHTDPHLVAGFGDPQELEPDRRAGGSRDLRRLTGLLLQPLALDPFGGPEKPVWHCSVRAAPGDRVLSDAEWAQVAASVLERTGFGPEGDDRAVRWVAVRHAADHIHIVATLARQDGGRVKTWNDFFRVREAYRAAERRLGLTATAPADRTAAKRASRAETEQAARRGWDEAPRVSLRREVCAAAAGAGSEREFLARLEQAGVLVRKRLSTVHPVEVTGYAVGRADHTTKDGSVIWYGGGKLATDLTLPNLRARWAGPATAQSLGAPVHGVMARAVLRARVTVAAGQARDDAGFFAQLREAGVLVRLRYSESTPGEVTGYAVALPGHAGQDGEPRWYGGARLASGLTLPQLRRHWDRQPGAPGSHPGPFRFTAPERDAFFRHAARQAKAAADQIRRSAGETPPRPPIRPGRRPPRSMPPPERSVIRPCAGPPTCSTGPPTGRSRTGPQRETGSGPPPGSSPWQAAARPTPRRPRFTWRRASSGWPGRSASCARRSSTPRRRRQRGKRPKACTPRSAGRGRAPLRWASPPRRGRPRPSASPQTQHGLIFRSRSSLGHSRRTAAVTPPRNHLRGQDLRRTLPRVRARAGEPSQCSHDPPHRAMASRSTRSRIRSFRPWGVATWVMTPSSSSTPPRANPAIVKRSS